MATYEAKYRPSLTQAEIVRLVAYCKANEDYDLYVSLNKLVNKINGGNRQPDFVIRGVSGDSTGNIGVGTAGYTGSRFPATRVSADGLVDKFLMEGNARMTVDMLMDVCCKLIDSKEYGGREAEFIGQLHAYCFGMQMASMGDSHSVIDLNKDYIETDFDTVYADLIGQYRVLYIKYGEDTNMTHSPLMPKPAVSKQNTGSFMDYIPPVDSMSQVVDTDKPTEDSDYIDPRELSGVALELYNKQRNVAMQTDKAVINSVVDVLNKFGL